MFQLSPLLYTIRHFCQEGLGKIFSLPPMAGVGYVPLDWFLIPHTPHMYHTQNTPHLGGILRFHKPTSPYRGVSKNLFRQ